MFGKFNIADALRQYGINPCTIVEGRNADAQFPFSDWNKEQLKQVNHLVDHIYSGFVQKVGPATFQMPLLGSQRDRIQSETGPCSLPAAAGRRAVCPLAFTLLVLGFLYILRVTLHAMPALTEDPLSSSTALL